LRHFIQLWRSKHAGKQLCVEKDDPGFRKDTETFIIRQIQCEAFEKEIENLKVQKPIQKDRAILKLDPFIDNEVLRHFLGSNIAMESTTQYTLRNYRAY
jgi:hypothetical protein